MSARQPLEPPSNVPFSLHDPQCAWIVAEGALDVFLAGQEGQGARRHVLRTESGSAVFGFAPASGGLALTAVPVPGTRLLLRDGRELCREAGQEALLERWIESLSAAATDEAPPRSLLRLEPGACRVGEVPQALSAPAAPLWVRPRRGRSRFLGQAELPADAFFPVSRTAWVEAEPGAELEVCATAEVAERAAGLLALHERALSALSAQSRRQDAQDLERQARRRQRDDAMLQGALRRLAGTLDEGIRPEPGEGDALLRAVQAVGRAQGIEFVPARGRAPVEPVAAIARASGVRSRQVVLQGEWWRQDCGPLLAFRDADQRPLALLPASPTRYRLYDPADGTSVDVTAEVAAKLSGFASVFYRPFPRRPLSLFDLLAFGAAGCRRDVFTLLAAGALSGALATTLPLFTGIVFDSVIPAAARGQLAGLAAALLAVAVCSALLAIVHGHALLRLEGRMEATLQAALWDRLLGQPLPFFRQFTSADLAVRALGLSQIRQTLTSLALGTVLSSVFSGFSFLLLLHYDVPLALRAAALVAVALAATSAFSVLQVRVQRVLAEAQGKVTSTVVELIRGIAKIRMAGAEERAFAVWVSGFARQKEAALRSRRLANLLETWNAAFAVLALAVLYHRIASVGGLSTGEVLGFLAAFGQLLAGALQLGSTAMGILAVVPLYERARPVLEALPEVDLGRGDPGELRGELELQHVAFRYGPDLPLVLKDVSLRVHAGAFVAIVGESGSGKSTLLRLLLGFERPTSGSLYYDGRDLEGLDVQAVRRQLGVVLQHGKLMTGDIASNIVGSSTLGLEDAKLAVARAGLEEDIAALPMGLHTLVSEGGGQFSGGQRQRLMIARAIVGQPRILLFDEATSALDNQTQAVVSRSLQELQATRVVIAHRLSTMRGADQIVVLEDGRVAESGTYEELMAKEGAFFRLARRQLAEPERT